jgi:hypothetical protein
MLPQCDDVDPVQPIYFDVDTNMLNIRRPDSMKKKQACTAYLLMGFSVFPNGKDENIRFA